MNLRKVCCRITSLKQKVLAAAATSSASPTETSEIFWEVSRLETNKMNCTNEWYILYMLCVEERSRVLAFDLLTFTIFYVTNRTSRCSWGEESVQTMWFWWLLQIVTFEQLCGRCTGQLWFRRRCTASKNVQNKTQTQKYRRKLWLEKGQRKCFKFFHLFYPVLWWLRSKHTFILGKILLKYPETGQ